MGVKRFNRSLRQHETVIHLSILVVCKFKLRFKYKKLVASAEIIHKFFFFDRKISHQNEHHYGQDVEDSVPKQRPPAERDRLKRENTQRTFPVISSSKRCEMRDVPTGSYSGPATVCLPAQRRCHRCR